VFEWASGAPKQSEITCVGRIVYRVSCDYIRKSERNAEVGVG